MGSSFCMTYTESPARTHQKNKLRTRVVNRTSMSFLQDDEMPIYNVEPAEFDHFLRAVGFVDSKHSRLGPLGAYMDDHNDLYTAEWVFSIRPLEGEGELRAYDDMNSNSEQGCWQFTAPIFEGKRVRGDDLSQCNTERFCTLENKSLVFGHAKNTHIFSPFLVCDQMNRALSPSSWEYYLPDALVEIIFTVSHHITSDRPSGREYARARKVRLLHPVSTGAFHSEAMWKSAATEASGEEDNMPCLQSLESVHSNNT